MWKSSASINRNQLGEEGVKTTLSFAGEMIKRANTLVPNCNYSFEVAQFVILNSKRRPKSRETYFELFFKRVEDTVHRFLLFCFSHCIPYW